MKHSVIEIIKQTIYDYLSVTAPFQLARDVLAVVAAVLIVMWARRGQKREPKAYERKTNIDELFKLNELRKSRVITDSEFVHQKGLLLGTSSQPNTPQPTAVKKGPRKKAELWLSISAAASLVILAVVDTANRMDGASPSNSALPTAAASAVPSDAALVRIGDQKVALAAADFMAALRDGGVNEVREKLSECYSKATNDSLLYCLAFDVAATESIQSVEQQQNWPPTEEFKTDVYAQRTTSALIQHGVVDKNAQALVMRHIGRVVNDTFLKAERK